MEVTPAGIKREILDFIYEYGGINQDLSQVKKFIDEYGEDSPAVQNWLMQFEDCDSAADFMVRYSMDDETFGCVNTDKKVVGVFFKERSGSSFYISTADIKISLFSVKMPNILRIYACGLVFVFSAGCRIPSEAYCPDNDVVDVTLAYADGSSEKPYPHGRVNLKDLHERMVKT